MRFKYSVVRSFGSLGSLGGVSLRFFVGREDDRSSASRFCVPVILTGDCVPDAEEDKGVGYRDAALILGLEGRSILSGELGSEGVAEKWERGDEGGELSATEPIEEIGLEEAMAAAGVCVTAPRGGIMRREARTGEVNLVRLRAKSGISSPRYGGRRRYSSNWLYTEAATAPVGERGR